jgi:hypothetical protein
MRPELHPTQLTPAERRTEVAALLATALSRLHQRAALPTAAPQPNFPQNLRDFVQNPLELTAKTRLSVTTG